MFKLYPRCGGFWAANSSLIAAHRLQQPNPEFEKQNLNKLYKCG
jgi:hypothetical protein